MSSSDLIPSLVKNLLREDYEKIDLEVPKLIKILCSQGASECWHKHGTFKAHLFQVWSILSLWNQSKAIARCGLFHSAYSNSYVNLAIFKANTDRELVKNMIGEEAEEFVYQFCVIPRHELIIEECLKKIHENSSWRIPREGLIVKHIKTGEDIHVSKKLIGIFLILTMADFCDQFYEWQDNLFENTDGKFIFKGNNFTSLWPGTGKPGLWMSALSKMGILVRDCYESFNEIVIPPVFDHCTKILTEESERTARDLYWSVIYNHTEKEKHDEAITKLKKAIELNPWFGEPLVLLSQILIQRGNYEEAEKYAKQALNLFIQWGTTYDKRISWEGWIAWTRVLIQNSRKKYWPTTSFGVLNLGLVQ
jgi:hypothetical protein